MSLRWIKEAPAYWDGNKARIVGAAPSGAFGGVPVRHPEGELLPDDWWHVEDDGQVVGYGWMDTTWGDAEILLAVDPGASGRGVGAYILDRLEDEARARGLNYVYNRVSPGHPNREELTEWLKHHRFQDFDDGSLMRAVIGSRMQAG